jgi:NADPH:quinone reductase-like Zn-dependent oxidoreductase
VKIEASGLCHTDIHAAHGDWPVKPRLPFIPGHEGVGRVAMVGPEVTEVKEGDRVASPGSAMPAGPANTVSPDGRRCAKSSSIPATSWMEAMPSIPKPSHGTSAKFPTGSIRLKLRLLPALESRPIKRSR